MQISTTGRFMLHRQKLERLAATKPATFQLETGVFTFPIKQLSRIVHLLGTSDFSPFQFDGEIDYCFDTATQRFEFDLSIEGFSFAGSLPLLMCAVLLDNCRFVDGCTKDGQKVIVTRTDRNIDGEEESTDIEVSTADYLSEHLTEEMAYCFAGFYAVKHSDKLFVEPVLHPLAKVKVA